MQAQQIEELEMRLHNANCKNDSLISRLANQAEDI